MHTFANVEPFPSDSIVIVCVRLKRIWSISSSQNLDPSSSSSIRAPYAPFRRRSSISFLESCCTCNMQEKALGWGVFLTSANVKSTSIIRLTVLLFSILRTETLRWSGVGQLNIHAEVTFKRIRTTKFLGWGYLSGLNNLIIHCHWIPLALMTAKRLLRADLTY